MRFVVGALSFRVKDGTAKGCTIKGDSLSAKSAGTCVVTAIRQAKGTTPVITSGPTVIRFDKSASSAKVLTITFAAHSSALDSASEIALKTFATSLNNGDSLLCTGYAKADTALASQRAAVVAQYLTNLVRVHVTLRSVTKVANNLAVITA
jgi:outer membrane protein OmpA-like peptidoglycan-associated protein